MLHPLLVCMHYVLFPPVVPHTHAALAALLVSRTAAARDSAPTLSRALVSEWTVLRQAGMWEAALQLALRACDADPTYPAAWSALGYTQAKLGWVQVAVSQRST